MRHKQQSAVVSNMNNLLQRTAYLAGLRPSSEMFQ